MPFADPEKRKQHAKEYRLKHPKENRTPEQVAKASAYRRAHYKKNIDWLKANREEAMKKWTTKTLTSYQREMNKRVAGWKHSHNIKSANWEYVYNRFMGTPNCEFCGIEFPIKSNKGDKRCLDHHHASGEIRNILCGRCNNKRKPQDMAHMYVLQDLHRYFKYNEELFKF